MIFRIIHEALGNTHRAKKIERAVCYAALFIINLLAESENMQHNSLFNSASEFFLPLDRDDLAFNTARRQPADEIFLAQNEDQDHRNQ